MVESINLDAHFKLYYNLLMLKTSSLNDFEYVVHVILSLDVHILFTLLLVPLN